MRGIGNKNIQETKSDFSTKFVSSHPRNVLRVSE